MNSVSYLRSIFPNEPIILDAAIKTEDHLTSNEIIMVSISGGSDSDILIDLIERLGYPENVTVKYVWFNTGLEYEATKKHIEYLECKYKVEIIERKARRSIPTVCKKYGVPFLSKMVSENISRLQKHGFQWEDGSFDELSTKYENCKSALRWWCNEWGEGSKANISNNRWLKEFLIENPPDFPISAKCCDWAKKVPAHDFSKEISANLNVTGVRKNEGGARAMAYSSCFTNKSSGGGVSQFRPIFYFSDLNKRDYELHRNIQHSDCYVKYGLTRTGCACCPFGKNFEKELAVAEKFEPNLCKAANVIFEKSYEFTRKYLFFKQKCKLKNAKCKLKIEN